ncbi:MAG: hypothetical protein E6Q76_04925 [Rhizobium sp.]|nr:MAG: hypothetical protein E6Q76_04925 [Rhizobium sp.]
MQKSKTTVGVLVVALTLSACAPLYSTTRDWKAPPFVGDYVVSATMNVGLFITDVTISVNGRKALSGQQWFWSDTLTLEGDVEHVPVAALCHIKAKTCDVTIAGLLNTKLQF